MAKLYFSFAAMNAGKSTILLQANHNYLERGMHTHVLTAAIDDRAGAGKIASRIGLEAKAYPFEASDDLYQHLKLENDKKPLDAVFLDEAQFLSEEQVWQLARFADEFSVPVLCYGLRTDFQGKLFDGSAALLAIADSLREIRTICWCGRKASMVLRIDEKGTAIKTGEQINIGGDDSYVSVCRQHWVSGETRG